MLRRPQPHARPATGPNGRRAVRNTDEPRVGVKNGLPVRLIKYSNRFSATDSPPHACPPIRRLAKPPVKHAGWHPQSAYSMPPTPAAAKILPIIFAGIVGNAAICLQEHLHHAICADSASVLTMRPYPTNGRFLPLTHPIKDAEAQAERPSETAIRRPNAIAAAI